MRFEFEWLDAPGVQDRLLASTWARLSLRVGDTCASESIDPRSNSRRTSIYGSLFPLTEWIVEGWWHLLNEPSPRSPAPSGRSTLPPLRSWVQRHNLLAAREGGALPDLAILRDGDEILLQWVPDPPRKFSSQLRFVGQGSERVPVSEFQRSLRSFVDAVLGRLEENEQNDSAVRRLVEAWSAILSANADETRLCQSLAVMGVDPYNPEEASDSLIDVAERGIKVLSDELREDLFEGSDSGTLKDNLDWVERERAGLRSLASACFPTVDSTQASTPHEAGYRAARLVRTELLGVQGDEPLLDLNEKLEARLGWLPGCFRLSSAQIPLEGIVGVDRETSALVLINPRLSSNRAQRFRLARAAYYPVANRLGKNARLLSPSTTPDHRAARAFAAELLAPAAALKNRVSGRVDSQDLESLAVDFEVDPLVIEHQVKNHRLAYVEA